MHVSYPYRFDGRGRTAETDEQAHVRDLVEQLLFTTPGERVNRPDFGSGLLQLLFAPGGDALAAAAQFAAQAALQQWLGDLVVVEAVEASAEDVGGGHALRVTVQYVLRRTQERHTAELTRTVGGRA
jgi:phage baseplate assembly protein W